MSVLTPEQFLSRELAQDLIDGPIGSSPLSNDPAPGSDRVTATRAGDRSLAMVYASNGRAFAIHMQKLAEAGRPEHGCLLVQSSKRFVAGRRR